MNVHALPAAASRLDRRTYRPTFLSDAFVEELEPILGGRYRVWDTTLKGFNVWVHPSGRRTYCVHYRRGAQTRWYVIGSQGEPWTADEARIEANRILGAVERGKDPQADKQQARRKALTVSRLIDLYLRDGPKSRLGKRDGSWENDRSCLVWHVRPLLGTLAVGDVRRSDVSRMVKAVWEGQTAVTVKTKRQGIARVRGGLEVARRTLCSTQGMFTWAIEQEIIGTHPARGIRLPKGVMRDRHLSLEEAERLFATLSEMERAGQLSARYGDIFRLLLLTGARKMEIQALRWSEVDIEGRQLVLPAERTKSGARSGGRRIPLSSHAISIIARQPQTSDFVFPAARAGVSPFTTGLQKAWEDVRVRAALNEVRMHDLRHGFASFALTNNENIYAISRVLGHASARSTERYLHIDGARAGALSERTGAFILGYAG
ncbi:MAG TPA: tyrosine-type recombinase/integrase [Caulobacteraceae bacterium]|nr:tyrosine-type recombinase/integrase [Caulobacteraceae bacterium]